MNFEKVSPTPTDKKLLGDESVERLLSIVWFNLSRKENTEELKEVFKEVLEKIKQRLQTNHDPIKTLEYLEMVLRTIAYTRDIRYGKGERDLSYMMIYALYKFFPIPAIYLMKEIVGQNEESYGSWKDIPRLCDYIKKETNEHNPLIITLVEMATNRLKTDVEDQKSQHYPPGTQENYSNFPSRNLMMEKGKELQFPRRAGGLESAKRILMKGLEILRISEEPGVPPKKSNVAKWIPREGSKYGWLFDIFVKNYYQLSVAPTNKNRSNFRKLVSKTNREIGTADKPKSKHMPPIKYLNFSIPIDAFIKKAKKITENLEIKKLDDQWEKYSKQWSALNKNIIPLVDVSAEMTEPEYNTAIGIGILLSQNSILKNRLICFSQTASWISLNENLGFTNTVKEIMNTVPPPTSRLINTGFKLIKDAILETGMTKDQINNLELVIVSNFTNDSCHDYNFNGNITEKKMKNMPKMTYWNISQNMTIPNKEKDQIENTNGGIKYIAGQVSLEEFKSKETKIETIRKILANPRYDKIKNMFESIIH
jgi:hypothetical protein